VIIRRHDRLSIVLVVISCGVLLLNPCNELFVCHATGTARWDLPKGVGDDGETPLQTALRETREEAGLGLDPTTLLDLGEFAYLRAKRLHLYAAYVAVDAIDIKRCRCRSTFAHHAGGKPQLEVDGYAWKPITKLDTWCGKNLSRVLAAIDWASVRRLPLLQRVPID
jgi:putative (di)nucleoside polyphosphate hydrolase